MAPVLQRRAKMDTRTPPFVVWKASFAVDIPTIDEEHRRLLGMMSELHDAMIHGESDERLRRLHAHLAAYAAVHFSCEEDLLEGVQFPTRAAHRKQHAWFIDKLRTLEVARSEASRATLASMKDWFVDHICYTDKAFATWVERRSVALAPVPERRFARRARSPAGGDRALVARLGSLATPLGGASPSPSGVPRLARPVLRGVKTRPRTAPA